MRMRDAEIRGLQWERMDLSSAILTVGDSNTGAGEGRTSPGLACRTQTRLLLEHSSSANYGPSPRYKQNLAHAPNVKLYFRKSSKNSDAGSALVTSK